MIWIYDDGGRAAAGFRGEARDCTRCVYGYYFPVRAEAGR